MRQLARRFTILSIRYWAFEPASSPPAEDDPEEEVLSPLVRIATEFDKPRVTPLEKS